MKDGWIKTAACSPEITVANVQANENAIKNMMREAAAEGAQLIVFPELCLTGYTCGDLFLQQSLLNAAEAALLSLAESTKELDALVFVGVPLVYEGKLYDTAAALHRGQILGVIPKRNLPNYNEFYEKRYFSPGEDPCREVYLGGKAVPFGRRLLFPCVEMPELTVGAEICEDLWAPVPPGTWAALAGATVVVNLSASNELTGKAEYRRNLVTGQSARCVSAYVYASAGAGESTQDTVFSGHCMIAENGKLLAESERFSAGMILTEIDVNRLSADRRRMTSFEPQDPGFVRVPFSLTMKETQLTRKIDPAPFVPDDPKKRNARCEEILRIQSEGLAKRLRHTGLKSAVVGISGGLDSTLALLVTAKAFDLTGLDRKEICAVTMPGFGTTDRTHGNAEKLIGSVGAEFREISIVPSVRQHFKDIGHDEAVLDVTYENSQARERTQILMDLANQKNALVIGTGDLSELALGWATYNGDHMSMYGVNAGVPKTLIRYLVENVAQTCGNEKLSSVLNDILNTPVSPELLPPENGNISQKTEELVGPYELHDFFLYYFLRFGFTKEKILRLAVLAFDGTYPKEEIEKWLRVFLRRFFVQQFKRSCLPDGPKVGSVALSPRGDLRMPSDASAESFLS